MWIVTLSVATYVTVCEAEVMHQNLNAGGQAEFSERYFASWSNICFLASSARSSVDPVAAASRWTLLYFTFCQIFSLGIFHRRMIRP